MALSDTDEIAALWANRGQSGPWVIDWTTAVGLLAVVGFFDIAGDDRLGWLTNRITRACCWPFTAACAGSRLLALPALVGPSVEPPLLVVVALFGLDWVATIPPTVVLYRAAFGPEPGGIAT
jgi:hypothetical protein